MRELMDWSILALSTVLARQDRLVFRPNLLVASWTAMDVQGSGLPQVPVKAGVSTYLIPKLAARPCSAGSSTLLSQPTQQKPAFQAQIPQVQYLCFPPGTQQPQTQQRGHPLLLHPATTVKHCQMLDWLSSIYTADLKWMSRYVQGKLACHQSK